MSPPGRLVLFGVFLPRLVTVFTVTGCPHPGALLGGGCEHGRIVAGRRRSSGGCGWPSRQGPGGWLRRNSSQTLLLQRLSCDVSLFLSSELMSHYYWMRATGKRDEK